MENPSTDVSSPGFLFMGKPSSTRSGPNGDIQHTPAPTDLRISPKLIPLVKALPISKNATPRSPYCSMIGNRSSTFITAAVSPPMTSLLLQSGGSVGSVEFETQVFSLGPKLRSLKPRIELMPPRK